MVELGSGMLLKLYRFWFEKQPATPLGLMRITYGLVLLLSFGSIFADVPAFYSGEGYIASDYVPSFFREIRFSMLDGIQSPIGVYAFYAVFMGVLVFFTIGYKTSYAKVLLFIMLLSFHERNFLVLNSGDTLLRVLAFYFMISPVV